GGERRELMLVGRYSELERVDAMRKCGRVKVVRLQRRIDASRLVVDLGACIPSGKVAVVRAGTCAAKPSPPEAVVLGVFQVPALEQVVDATVADVTAQPTVFAVEREVAEPRRQLVSRRIEDLRLFHGAGTVFRHDCRAVG